MTPIETYDPKPLLWEEKYSTGNKVLDDQHIYLIETINKLGEVIRTQGERDQVGKCLSILKFYAGWHFEREEDCMEAYHCPIAGKNKKAHTVFISKIDSFQREFNQSNAFMQIAIRIHKDITDWIINHILVLDTQLVPCIRSNPKSSPSSGR